MGDEPSFDSLKVSTNDGIATIRINRPQALNALDTATLTRLGETLMSLDRDPSVGVVILTGNGERAFCAGGDIKEIVQSDSVAIASRIGLAQRVFQMIEDLSKPVVAVLHGYVLGGGCEMALACDIRIATHECQIALNEVQLGGIPSWGGTYRLPRLIGRSRAMELILTGRRVSGGEAFQIGLIHQLAATKEEGMELALAIAAGFRASSQVALEYAKSAVVKSSELNPNAAMELERLYSRLIPPEDNIQRIEKIVNLE